MIVSVRIDADIAINGKGEKIINASLVYENEIITYFGENEHAPSADQHQQVPFIMPGMWDCHVHLFGLKDLNSSHFTNPYIKAARAVGDLKAMVRAGITSVRELGGMGVYLDQAVAEESIIGPKIYGAGSMLSMTGGHGDFGASAEIPVEANSLISSYIGGELVDGPDNARLGVRKQLRRGAEVIKVTCSGGGMSITDPKHPQFTLEELKAIVDEASRAERVVAAHAHGAQGIKQAIEAGVRTIEHGSYLDEDLCDLMIEKDVILVPTITIPTEVSKVVDQMPPHTQAKIDELFGAWIPAFKLAIKKGVKIAMGTDLLISGKRDIMGFGSNAKELEFYVNYGMTEMDALTAATGHGPLTVGARAEKSGVLDTGYQADFVLLDRNPLVDITVLTNPSSIISVTKKGQTY